MIFFLVVRLVWNAALKGEEISLPSPDGATREKPMPAGIVVVLLNNHREELFMCC